MSALIATGASIRETWEALMVSEVPMAQRWAFMIDHVAKRANSDPEIGRSQSMKNAWAFADDINFLRAEIRTDLEELRDYLTTQGPEFAEVLQVHEELAASCEKALHGVAGSLLTLMPHIPNGLLRHNLPQP
jgi:hypothetical protein